MSLGDEVVLPADATEHPAVLQLVGDPGAEQGHGEGAVDEARVAPLQTLQLFLAVQVVDEANAGHADPGALFQRHLAQAPVERQRTEEKAAVQPHPALHRRLTALGGTLPRFVG